MSDIDVIYKELVDLEEVTCIACPYQVQGTLKDGKFFYFRYRFGRVSLAIGDRLIDVDGAMDVVRTIGEPLDGSLTEDEYRSVFVLLYLAWKSDQRERT